MRFILLLLAFSANVFAATTTTTTTAIPAPSSITADGKVHFEIFTTNDPGTPIGQALQLLALEKANPELYTVGAHYFGYPNEKFVTNTFWKTVYVAQFHRAQLAEWLQCVYFDPETHTCGPLLKIDFKNLKSKEKEMRKELAANLKLSNEYKNKKDTVFINGERYDGPLAYGQLLNVVNPLLPKEKQLAGLGKYETTTLYAIGNNEGFGTRDLSLEREFARWIPNLQIQTLTPDQKQAVTLLKAAESPGIPAYIFDKNSVRNVAVQKLAVAGRIKVKDSNYALFDFKANVTEMHPDAKVVPNQLDLWVMSQCPFGVKAEGGLINARAQNAIPENVKVNVRYIVGEAKVEGKTTWQSLHGDPELQEDIRQIAIQKTWPDKFWKYLEARNVDYHAEDWKAAATTAGLNPTEVEATTKLGRKLLAQDIKDAAQLKVSGSPTYMWQNTYVLKTDAEMKGTMGFNPQDFKELKATTTDHKPASTPDKKQAVAPAAEKCGS
jgi:hypothetical protein